MTTPRRLAQAALLTLIVLAAALISLSGARASAPASLVVDLTDYRGGSIYQWLQAKGFRFEQDAKNPEKIALTADARAWPCKRCARRWVCSPTPA